MFNLIERSWNPATPNDYKERTVRSFKSKVAGQTAADALNRGQDLKADGVVKSYSVEPAKARLDKDKSAKPLTRIVHHPNPNHCIAHGLLGSVAVFHPEYEDETGARTSLAS
jgi:hypothetical protein